MIHVHRLDGCAPAPLAHYLKALGILRLVAEQIDPAARGWWEGDHFRLVTTLNSTELENFFLLQYEPTPLVSPWNKGSGFFTEEDSGLSPLEHSKSARFKKFREGIETSRSVLDDLSRADKEVRTIKAETKVTGMRKAERDRIKGSEDYKKRLRKAENKFKRLKAELIPGLRSKWRGGHREWMDAAMVLGDEGTPKFPALLGTGGNDGRLDFTNNFMQRLAEIFDLDSDGGTPRNAATSWIGGSLWGMPVPGCLTGRSVGQYLPGTAGGANNGNGPEGQSMVNPVDFVLMLEGAIVFTSHATRRFGSLDSIRAASPFAVNARAAAYVSASTNDESARGEQWMPLWSNPSTLTELGHLLAEGRAQIGARAAHEPLDLARAIARLGTARGISGFQRYGYIERNGQSNLAVPLGRFSVADHQTEYLACIDDLETWLRHIHREARDQNAPARLIAVERRLAEAIFAVTQHAGLPEFWQRVLLQLADVEEIMAAGSGYVAQPVPNLRPEWVSAAYDGTAEFRLALAFALQFHRQDGTPADPVRRHWLPLDRKKPWRFATTGTGVGTRLDVQPEVVMQGRCGLDDAVALIERRLVEASRRQVRHLPLKAAPYAATNISDLTTLLAGDVDLDRTLALGRALMALDRKAWAMRRITIEAPPRAELWPDDAWLAIRLCALPWPFKMRSGFELDIGTDPAMIRRLAVGDAATAVAIALRRLGAAGVRCTVRAGIVPSDTARLWAAALAFPITKKTAGRFLHRLDPSKE